MLRIVVEGVKVSTKEGVSRKTGQKYSIREQQAFAYLTERDGTPLKYPTPCVIGLKDGAEPYPVGEYTLSASSFVAGPFGGLQMGRVELEPVAAGKAVRAA